MMRPNFRFASTEGLKGHPEPTENGMPVLNTVNKVTAKLLGTVETLVTATARALALSFIVGACSSAPQPSAGTAPVGNSSELPASAPSGSSLLDGVFTSSQASRGEQRFSQVCAGCHSNNEFRGGRFRIRWAGRTAGDIFEVMSTTMPEDDPGSLSLEDYANLLAYFLQLNGYPAGEEPLPGDVSALQNLRIEEPPAR